jgi:hypothetical protein
MIAQIDLKSVALTLLIVFVMFMMYITLVFIRAIFKFPTLREKLWHGITNGDMVPDHDDFQRTAQLFFSYLLGFLLITCFLLWISFPISEWHIIVPSVSAVFIACVGLKYKNKKV